MCSSDLGQADAARFIPLELTDLTSVRAAAEVFLSWGWPLHALINNAGVAGAHGQTPQGFELAFGTNHLGHFHLTQLLLPNLLRTGSARVVTVASRAHHAALKGIDWDTLQKPTQSRWGISEYAVSKLANILFASELARRMGEQGLLSFSLHPGVIQTEVWRHAPWWTRPLMALRGMKTPDMWDAAIAGRLKGLWIIGYDVAQTDPNLKKVHEALRRVEFLVVQDLFLSETAKFAQFVLQCSILISQSFCFTLRTTLIKRFALARVGAVHQLLLCHRQLTLHA